ncbi:MAG: prepilin-type N-terminal cleavage/methylation domain-containing protein [Hydrogenothermaceae bacterium]|nr:prepilin-type N-terminal cleavage/methylation domain-containing protein [Hydrogenothermaceae bacterium]
MFLKKGFTLLEILIAITIIGVTFTVAYGLLYKSRADLDYTLKLFDNFLYIDSSIKEGKTSDLNKTEKDIPGYPIKEITYEKNGVYIKLYQIK